MQIYRQHVIMTKVKHRNQKISPKLKPNPDTLLVCQSDLEHFQRICGLTVRQNATKDHGRNRNVAAKSRGPRTKILPFSSLSILFKELIKETLKALLSQRIRTEVGTMLIIHLRKPNEDSMQSSQYLIDLARLSNYFSVTSLDTKHSKFMYCLVPKLSYC